MKQSIKKSLCLVLCLITVLSAMAVSNLTEVKAASVTMRETGDGELIATVYGVSSGSEAWNYVYSCYPGKENGRSSICYKHWTYDYTFDYDQIGSDEFILYFNNKRWFVW